MERPSQLVIDHYHEGQRRFTKFLMTCTVGIASGVIEPASAVVFFGIAAYQLKKMQDEFHDAESLNKIFKKIKQPL